jgi:hypothetical protein
MATTMILHPPPTLPITNNTPSLPPLVPVPVYAGTLSPVYGGLDYSFAVDKGTEMGRKIGAQALAKKDTIVTDAASQVREGGGGVMLMWLLKMMIPGILPADGVGCLPLA